MLGQILKYRYVQPEIMSRRSADKEIYSANVFFPNFSYTNYILV